MSSDRQALQPAATAPEMTREGGEAPASRQRWRPSILLVLLPGFGGLTVAAAGTVTLIGYEIARRNTYELIGIAAQNAIGEAVNVAQRLEQLAKEFDDGADVIVVASGATLAAVPPDLPRRALGTRTVRGFDGPIEVYRLG